MRARHIRARPPAYKERVPPSSSVALIQQLAQYIPLHVRTNSSTYTASVCAFPQCQRPNQSAAG